MISPEDRKRPSELSPAAARRELASTLERTEVLLEHAMMLVNNIPVPGRQVAWHGVEQARLGVAAARGVLALEELTNAHDTLRALLDGPKEDEAEELTITHDTLRVLLDRPKEDEAESLRAGYDE